MLIEMKDLDIFRLPGEADLARMGTPAEQASTRWLAVTASASVVVSVVVSVVANVTA
jgi:hypothetical protein